MRYFFLFFVLLGSLQLDAQNGNYFLSHYSPAENQLDNVCFDMIQDARGMVYFATPRGVQRFDGRDWKMIGGKGAIYTLQLSLNGDIVWAGAAGFGTIEIDKFGEEKLKKHSSETIKDVFESLVIQKQAFFVTENALIIHDLQTGKTSTISSTNLTGSITGIFELFGSAYLNTERGGIVKVEGTRFSKSGFKFNDDDEVVFTSIGDRQRLIALSDNRVFLADENMQIREVKLQDSAYVDASVIVSGAFVNTDLFVLGTLRGGMIFVHTATGKTQEIINYSTGLPDNEIYALAIDRSLGIWAAHEYGFTRVAPYLPFRSFGHYPGLAGNLLCATSFNGNVYVGTSLGLFKLEKEDVYDEIIYYIDVEVKPKKSGDTPKVDPTIEQKTLPETESRKKSFWRLFRRSKTPAAEVVAPEEKTQVVEEKDGGINDKHLQKVKKTERVLRTSQFAYRKITGINAKITQLEAFNNRLLAIGLGGVYEIQENNARPILEEPVRMAYASPSTKTLFISTYADELKVHEATEKGWVASRALENLDDRITSIFEGEDGELWLLAVNKAYRLEFDGKDVKAMQTIDVSNPNYDELVGVHYRNEIVVVNTQGFFKLNRAQGAFTVVDSLPKPLHYFAGEGGIFYKDSHSWATLGLTRQQNLKLMNLLHEIRFVSQERNSENLWVITDENELHKFFGDKFTPYETGFPLYLKSMQGALSLNKKSSFELDQEKSELRLAFVQPDFLAAEAIEYRYQLKGLDKGWSDWSAQNDAVDFAYLPAGDYKFTVQSRDIFGNVKEFEAVPIEVLPPYWKRPWFYALEFFVFAALVMLSFRLSTRFRIISRLLSLLTIIMLIQFIQTVIGEMFSTKTSPVFDFFVQVVVAFMILPVEGYLRNLMLRSLDSSSRLYKFLSPKSNLKPREDRSVH